MTKEKPKAKERWYLPEEAEKVQASQMQKELEEDVENGTNDQREWPYGPFRPHVKKSGKRKSSGG